MGVEKDWKNRKKSVTREIEEWKRKTEIILLKKKKKCHLHSKRVDNKKLEKKILRR